MKALINYDNNLVICFSRVTEWCSDLFKKDVCTNKSLSNFGAESLLTKFKSDVKLNILTHCNTGSLATGGYGTALGVVRRLHEMAIQLTKLEPIRYIHD